MGVDDQGAAVVPRVGLVASQAAAVVIAPWGPAQRHGSLIVAAVIARPGEYGGARNRQLMTTRRRETRWLPVDVTNRVSPAAAVSEPRRKRFSHTMLRSYERFFEIIA